MNKIEQRIWDYLDGTCNVQERKEIEQLIETDPVYQAAYGDLKKLNQHISAIDLDEPSMSFSRNLMEKIQAEPIPGYIKSLIDKRIIYGIAGFFLLTIMALLVVLLVQVDWTQPVTGVLNDYKMPSVDFSKYMNNTVLKSFLFADIILGLYVLDTILRNRHEGQLMKKKDH